MPDRRQKCVQLPPLQPHLTGINGIEGRDLKAKLSASLAESRRPTRQGSDIFDSLSSPKHQSAVTELEVKLREALDKCNEATSAHLHEEGTERGPHKLRTAVCCQLLQELSHMAGPYSGVLKKLCHELVASIYSDCYASDVGSRLMDQLPFFSVADKLKAENTHLLEQQEAFSQELAASKNMAVDVQLQLRELSQALAASENQKAVLLSEARGLKIAARDARAYAEVARDELTSAQADAAAAKQQLDAVRADARAHAEDAAAVAQTLGEQLAEAAAARVQAETERNEARELMSGMISKQDVADLEERLRASEACAADQAAELHEQSTLIQTLECRTPRPDWSALLTGACKTALSEDECSAAVAIEGVASCALAARLADKLGAYASGLQEAEHRATMLEAVAAAEPDMLRVEHTVTLVDSSFTTQSGVPDSHEFALVHALGLGADLPRMLRQAGQVPIRVLSEHELTAYVVHLLTRLISTASSLHDTLYQHLQRCGQSHSHITASAYTLMYALQQHSSASPLLTLLHSALRGECSGQAVLQVAAALQASQSVLGEAAALQLPGMESAGTAPVEEAMQLVARLVPGSTDDELQALHACLSEVGQGADGGARGLVSFEHLAAHSVSALDTAWEARGSSLCGHRSDGLCWTPEEGNGVADDEAADTKAMFSEAESVAAVDASERAQHAACSADRCAGAPALLTLLAEQHAERLMRMHSAVQSCANGLASDLPDGGVSFTQLRDRLAAVPDLSAAAAQTACAELARCKPASSSSSAGIQATAAPELLARHVPLQCEHLYDVAAAQAWLQGLQARAQGLESGAALPDVA